MTWVSGSQFLIRPKEEWAVNPDGSGEILLEDPEVKRSIAVNTIQSELEEVDAVTQIINYSSWIQLRRIACWIFRLKNLLSCLSWKRKQKNLAFSQCGIDEALLQWWLPLSRKTKEGQNEDQKTL